MNLAARSEINFAVNFMIDGLGGAGVGLGVGWGLVGRVGCGVGQGRGSPGGAYGLWAGGVWA